VDSDRKILHDKLGKAWQQVTRGVYVPAVAVSRAERIEQVKASSHAQQKTPSKNPGREQ